jgi:hypothetical protein
MVARWATNSNEDLWDVIITSDNCLFLRTVSSNRLSPNTWLIPAGLPEAYATILSFWKIENMRALPRARRPCFCIKPARARRGTTSLRLVVSSTL